MYKVGDKVVVKNYKGILSYSTVKIGNIGVIKKVYTWGYEVYFKRKGMTLFFLEENLKLKEVK